MMGDRADKYRSLAHQCLLVAPTVSNQEYRLALIDMARVCLRLANEPDCAEAVVEQQQVQSKNENT